MQLGRSVLAGHARPSSGHWYTLCERIPPTPRTHLLRACQRACIGANGRSGGISRPAAVLPHLLAARPASEAAAPWGGRSRPGKPDC